MKTFMSDAGTILWLTRTASTHGITDGCLDHPVLILSPRPTGFLVCLITTLRSTPIHVKFPHASQRSHRLRYIPLAPADPHPDTHEIFYTETTGQPSVTKAGKQSYVRLHEPFFVPSGSLRPLTGGTARFSMRDMAVVKMRITGNNMKAVNGWHGGQECMKRKAEWSEGRDFKDGPYVRESSVQILPLERDYELLPDRFVGNYGGSSDENCLWRTLKFIFGFPFVLLAMLLSWFEWLVYTIVVGVPCFILRMVVSLVTLVIRVVTLVINVVIIAFLAVVGLAVLIAGTLFILGLVSALMFLTLTLVFALLRAAAEATL